MPEGKDGAAFPAAWLSANAYDRDAAHQPGWTGEGTVRWTKATMQDSVPRAGYVAASRDRAVAAAMAGGGADAMASR